MLYDFPDLSPCARHSFNFGQPRNSFITDSFGDLVNARNSFGDQSNFSLIEPQDSEMQPDYIDPGLVILKIE
jgi:hypothetical protein